MNWKRTTPGWNHHAQQKGSNLNQLSRPNGRRSRPNGRTRLSPFTTPSPPRASQLANFSPNGALHCGRSEEHTSELQSRENLVCRLLLEKKKIEYYAYASRQIV